MTDLENAMLNNETSLEGNWKDESEWKWTELLVDVRRNQISFFWFSSMTEHIIYNYA